MLIALKSVNFAQMTKTTFCRTCRLQRSCGKVMFLHLSVILFTGGCLPLVPGGSATPHPRVDPPGRHHPACWDTLPCPVHTGIYTPCPMQCMLGYGQQAALRIPLECILVLELFLKTLHASLQRMPFNRRLRSIL